MRLKSHGVGHSTLSNLLLILVVAKMRAKANFVLLPYLVQHTVSAPYEHVILADCKPGAFLRVSHMAYYAMTLTSAPDTVAVVPTPQNRTAVWARNGTNPLSATFPDGTVFTANISATIKSDFAGVGSNGFGSFDCWKYDRAALYKWYNGMTCDAVYDCNHQSHAGDDITLNATGTVAAPNPTMTSDPPGNNDRKDSDSKKSNDISLGVGLGLGIPTFLATIAGVWYASRQPRIREYLHSLNPVHGNSSGRPVRGSSTEQQVQNDAENAGGSEL